jgi:ribosomal protein S18 acetylase RimI-like enzyme
MSEVIIRAANIKDLEILLEFEQGVISAERPFEPTLKTGHINYYDIEKMIKSNDTEVMVATLNKEIIGSGYVKIERSKPFQKFDFHAYIGFMYVKPEHRGRGISQKVMDELVTWAKSKDISEIRLEVYSDNLPAIKAYQKAGYTSHMIKMRLDLGE